MTATDGSPYQAIGRRALIDTAVRGSVLGAAASLIARPNSVYADQISSDQSYSLINERIFDTSKRR